MSSLLLMLAALGQPALGAVHASPLPPAQMSHAIARKLTELRTSPGRFLGEEVRFTLQFRALVEDWNPYLSRFEPGRWLGLEVWPDELFTWDEAVFAAPAGRLFLRRGGGFEPLARRARTYQRYEARGRVREVFLGEPWIELLELVPLEGEVGEGTILHVTRARELAGEGQFTLALDQYDRARAAPLPPHALAAVLAEIRATEEARAESKSPARNAGQQTGSAVRPRSPEQDE